MDKKTKGSWLIHHTNKLQGITNQAGYEKTFLAGKAGILLSAISSNNHATLNNDRLNVLAQAANINTTFELPKLIEVLKQQQLVDTAKETLINGVREWNREPSCSRFPHRGKEVPIEHVFRRFRVVPGALCALRTECFQGWPATVSWRAPDWRDRTS
ncbi:hypothetical protein MAFF211471_24000 [Ralstonia solanacearum]|nr:hypothetical protein HWE45_11725 [Ralstonia solanacearum]QKZ33280.1 hypothetical protein HWE47_11715 [Ralstonia solanacearum]QMT09567.1 hypothetical protein H2F19_11620 [Ralstonia solanacearum]BCL87317.1 hypothetical protein MAFF211471_24000 [Ralstonia solanacearum]BCM99869.1 hypothetical protein RPSA_24060 [Ralstonia solanacearum]